MMPILIHYHFKQLLLSSLLWSLLGSEAIADYALLVGVSHYDHLKAEQQLFGPLNDVQLMKQLLLTKGFPDSHIQVLANGHL